MDIKERLAVIAYIAKKLPEISRNQVGKTTLQKLIYLFTREGGTNYQYTMYHYGPYSRELSFDIDMASDALQIINVHWIEDKGYDITVNLEKGEFIERNLPEEKRMKIDKLLSKYGDFNAVQLSLIATAYYVLDNTDIKNPEELVKIVSSIKPQYKDRVPDVLKKANVISN